MPEIVQFRSRELVVDDACIARAAAAGVAPVEQRLWEAGFSREVAKTAAAGLEPAKDLILKSGSEVIKNVDTPS